MAKQLDIFVELPPVENDLTVEDIAQRIQNNKESFRGSIYSVGNSENLRFDQ